MNARHSERVQYRKHTSCSVLKTGPDNTDKVNETDRDGNTIQLYKYNYGVVIDFANLQNYTYDYNAYDSFRPETVGRASRGYTLTFVTSLTLNDLLSLTSADPNIPQGASFHSAGSPKPN